MKKLIISLAQKHAWNIGVSNYEIDIHYMQDDKHIEDRDASVLGEMTTDRRYLKGTMKIYPAAVKKWKEHGDKILDDVVSHEIAHLATQHFYDVATARYCDDGEMKDAWETVTEVISRLSRRIKDLEEK